MEPSDHSSPPPRIAVVGAGRLGTPLAAALRAAGYAVEGPLGRGNTPSACDAVLLCVPDAAIPEAAASAAGAAPLVGHTSGATPLSAMDAAGTNLFGLHPLQTFGQTSGPESFRGIGCAVAGTDKEALSLARRIAIDLGMTPFEIDDAGRPAYHAAASIASNFLVTLEAAAERMAGGAGLDPAEARALLVPLVEQAVRNWAGQGPERALTGPVARGDEATVAAQRQAVGEVAPELLALFDELVARTRELASRAVPA
jgi:predicted short-subunit dehydrogenase-like oxidoreductase (DUF2520 family)